MPFYLNLCYNKPTWRNIITLIKYNYYIPFIIGKLNHNLVEFDFILLCFRHHKILKLYTFYQYKSYNAL